MQRFRARGTAGILAGLVALGLVGVASTPASAATTNYTLTGEPSVFYSGSFEANTAISPDTTEIAVDVPDEVDEVTGLDWTSELFSEGNFTTLTPSVASGVVSFDSLDGLFFPGGSGSLSLYGYGVDLNNAITITISFTVANSSGGPTTISWSASNLAEISVNFTEYWILDGESPLPVAPGDTVTITGPTGYFTTGMDGDWTDPATVDSFGVISNSSSGVNAPSVVSGDGSTVTLTIPRSSWAWAPGQEVYLDFRAYDFGSDIRFEEVSTTLNVQYGSVPAPSVDRVAGPDRFTVSQNIARESYPAGASTVYITNGLNYPDALSASPAAAFEGGPLLLTLPNALPGGLEQTIRDLDPDTIVVVGGPNSVNPSVYNQLSLIVGASNITRLGGADRFEASRNIARTVFSDFTAPTVYLATGLNFPDALSASAAAGAIGAPVVLVNGLASTLDAATLDLLDDLQSNNVFIAGGPNSVSEGIINQLNDLGFFASRISGQDRFEASSNIARIGFPTAERVFLATGFNFPDALAGAAWAASTGSPLIVVPGNCVPSRVLTDLRNYQVEEVTILGGPNSVTTAVESLTACAGFAWPDGLGPKSALLGSASAEMTTLGHRAAAPTGAATGR
jgi:putative cell wall-binding protein